jgi:hypothetical protein
MQRAMQQAYDTPDADLLAPAERLALAGRERPEQQDRCWTENLP